MKTTRILFLSLILLGAAAGTVLAASSVSLGLHVGPGGHTSVDVGFFYDDLATYGNWVERPNYGWAWRPRSVASSWRPYQAGHWVWTDEGWTWISDEPYGWATYHYGRWYDDPDYGWEWIPGNEWAPAWVAWQEGDDYVGWAPLPPSVDFRPGVELSVSLAPEAYVFVQERQFLAPRVADYFVPRADCVRIYRSTRNITRYNVVGNRVFNQGVQVDRLQRVVGRPVPRYQIADLNADQRHQGARVAQNRVAIFRPQVDKVTVAPPPSRPVARRAVLSGAAAAAAVTAHRANRAQVAGTSPQAASPQPTRQMTKEQRREIAQAPGRGAREPQPVPQAQQQPNASLQAAQQQAARQQRIKQQSERQAQRDAAQQQGEEQKAQRQAAQQQRAQQRQAQRQEAQQQPRPQRPPDRQEAQQQRRGQRQQAQRQPPPQQQPRNQGNQGKPPGKPRDDKQKPPQQ